ncbi:MAG: TolC family protein [Saprospiraceae bacterium]|nr:TolC family protein [Saprospiraceae bacterium]
MQRLTLFILLLLFSLAASAQQTMSLEDCVQYAYSSNPTIKTAQLQITDAEWRVKENLATGLPQISAGITYSAFLQRAGLPSSAISFGPQVPPGFLDDLSAELTDLPLLDGVMQGLLGGSGNDDSGRLYFAPVHNLSGELKISQLIFNNSYLLSLRATRYYKEYVNLDLASTRYKVRNQVTDAYLPALLISENLAVLDKNISNLDKLLADTRAINKAGFVEQLDVDRLEFSISNLRTERGNLARQQEIVIDALKFSMGMPVAEKINLSDNLEKLMAQYADADLTSQLDPMTRPDYLTLLKARQLSGIQVDLFSRTWLPTIAGFAQYQPGYQGGYGAKDSDNFNKWYFIPSAVAGVSISVPIWDGGGTKAKRQRAMITMQNVDIQKQMLENAMNFELETARKQYQNATERVASQQKNLELAQRIYDTTQTKYKAGVGSSFEVTQAEQGLYAAQQSLMSARFDLLTARVAIKKALGQ